MPCAHRVSSEPRRHAQTVTPDLFSLIRTSQIATPDLAAAPDRGGERPIRSTIPGCMRDKDESPRRRASARSRPTACRPPAALSASGYDSLNRKRKKPKYYPGQAKPKPLDRPRHARASHLHRTRRCGCSIPPSDTANKPPIPPAMAGTVLGQPPRKRLKIDDDPFGAVGDYAGSFLIKSAVEFSGGYDTNPGRLDVPQGSPFYVVAPEFLAVSDWERHALVADLRGSFTSYGSNLAAERRRHGALSAPLDVDRPNFIGHVDGRLDVTRDTRLLAQARLLVATDNPGSPNVQAGLARYPVYATYRRHLRRRPELQPPAGFRAAPPSTAPIINELEADRRHLDQQRRPQLLPVSAASARVSYELMPGLKPFGEVAGRQPRRTTCYLDRSGYARRFQRRLRQGRHQFRVLRGC